MSPSANNEPQLGHIGDLKPPTPSIVTALAVVLSKDKQLEDLRSQVMRLKALLVDTKVYLSEAGWPGAVKLCKLIDEELAR